MYDELVSNLEAVIESGNIEEVSEEQIKSLSFITTQNARIQKLLTELLEKKYKTMGLTTEQFIAGLPQQQSENAYENYLNSAKEKDYMKRRTECYIKSIQKKGDLTQQELLMFLQEEFRKKGESTKTPQYILYKNLSGEEDVAIIGFFGENTFVVRNKER